MQIPFTTKALSVLNRLMSIHSAAHNDELECSGQIFDPICNAWLMNMDGNTQIYYQLGYDDKWTLSY